MLELGGVVKHYRGEGEEVYAVDGVSLRVESGEMLALLGPSGSGKTTLLLLIAGLLRPEAGAIHYRGREITALSEREASEYLLRDVGFIFQSINLMPRVSTLENATRKLLLAGVGLREAKVRAEPWLQRVGLAHRLDHAAERLSGGERQRVAIARALASEPRLILADEPTGNLDSQRSKEIVELLRAVAHEQDACVLLVTHDQEAAALANRCVTLRDGKLIENEDAPNDADDVSGTGVRGTI